MNIVEITIDEFKNGIYEKYEELFPEKEQRNLEDIEKTYYYGIEKIYKIDNNGIIVGFVMLEKMPKLPYYLDVFAVFKEYQIKDMAQKQ